MLKFNLTRAQYMALAVASSAFFGELVHQQALPAKWAGLVVAIVMALKAVTEVPDGKVHPDDLPGSGS